MNANIFAVIFVYCFTTWRILALPDKLKIGGIFDENDKIQALAFRYAIENVNHERSLSPAKLLGETVNLPADDSFHASKEVCNLLETGVAAIFGPRSENTANHIQSICDALGVPHVEMRWHYKLTQDLYSINLYPHPSSLGQAYHDIIRELKWKKFVILYENNEGLLRMEHILKNSSDWSIVVRMLGEHEDWRILLKEMKDLNHKNFIVDVVDYKIPIFLRNASQIGLMHNHQNYLFTTLNLHTIDLEEYKLGGTNITALRLFDPNNPTIVKHLESWRIGEYYNHGISYPSGALNMTTEAALVYDAVHLFAKALADLEISGRIEVTPLYCEGDKTWEHGESIINYMKSYRALNETRGVLGGHGMGGMYEPNKGFMGPYSPTYIHTGRHPTRNKTFSSVRLFGLTGRVEFDNNGFRTDFDLQITELNREGMVQVGNWSKENGAKYMRNVQEEFSKISEGLRNKTFIALTALAEPYAQRKPSSEQLTGNDRYEGFCIDLLEAIAAEHGFNYTLKIQEDGAYGSLKGEHWDGIIGELLNGNAGLGIVDFTITSEREEAVDFTMPFMNLGIGILIKKPLKSSPALFSFMNPFSVDVWIYMATAYLGVSVLLFILARITPNEWDNPHPCIQDPEELENTITLSNAFWFTIGSLMQQGSDIAPKAVSTRIVAGIWWFFTLIMISSYTANLAAFLTVTRMESPIESAEDLAKQTKIKYGCKLKGSTYSFFQKSNITTYKKMWSAMENARPPVFTKSNDEGVARVKEQNGKFAFLMESSSIEYQVERNCDLMQVGGLLDSKSYGIALPPKSPYTNHFSSSILKLRENGALHRFKEKWWKKKGGGKCVDEDDSSSGKAAELGLPNVGGVFVVLLGGMGVSAVTAICEFFWNARELATDENATFCEELGKEVKFIMKCSGNTKPARKTAPPTPEEPLFTYGSYNGGNYSYAPERKPDLPAIS